MNIQILRIHKYIHELFKLNIKNRLFLYFIFLVFFPVFFITLTVFSHSTNIITKKINAEVERSMFTIEYNIMQKLNTVYTISSYIYLNSELTDILSSPPPDGSIAVYNEITTLQEVMENFYLYKGTKKATLIPKIYMLNRRQYKDYAFSDCVFDISKIENEQWYKKLPDKAPYSVTGSNSISGSHYILNTIKFARKLYSLKNPQTPYAALLTIDMNVEDFNSILNELKPSAVSSVFIIDSDCKVVIGADSDNNNKVLVEKYCSDKIQSANNNINSFTKVFNLSKMYITNKKFESLPWTIVCVSPVNELNQELTAFKNAVYVVLIICTIIALIASLLLSKSIERPIRKLVQSMSEVPEGNFDISIDYHGNDEFSYLIDKYNQMMREIKNLINKLYISEVNQKEAELKALQAQINPHFLYNTLDSINWIALKHNVTDISIMVTSLSDFFRYSLSKGKSIITLNNEKMQLESYLAIQKIRFSDKLDYKINFAPEILNCTTVKLILQPIVENAIIHGIEKKRGKGLLSIDAVKDNNLIRISIADNGAGTDINSLNRLLNDENNQTKSYGLKNVNKRIKNYFGDDYGLEFISNKDGGITVLITIPVRYDLEGLDVKTNNS